MTPLVLKKDLQNPWFFLLLLIYVDVMF
jgi:hypothetical protein